MSQDTAVTQANASGWIPAGVPIFVVSDLHAGDKGFRDNFSSKGNDACFNKFLDYLKTQGTSQLVILGDLFEFWQSNLSNVVVQNLDLLTRLAGIQAVYVLGNHDVDLIKFTGIQMLNHAFFDRMTGPFNVQIGKQTFRFMHGHELDEFNNSMEPSWGRILTIFAGIFEDKNNSPFLQSGTTVEGTLEQFGDALMLIWDVVAARLSAQIASRPDPKQEMTPSQNPSRVQESIDQIITARGSMGCDIAVVGHTHCLGRFPALNSCYYNSGHWSGNRNGFLRIEPDGSVQVFEWTADGKANEYAGLANQLD